jgi:hypothetical protein
MRKCFSNPFEIFTPLNHGFFHIWSIVIAWVANLALQKSNKFPISLRRFRRVPDRFLEKWDYNGKAKTFSNRFNGHSIFVSDDNLDPKDGLLFGGMLGQQLKARGLQYTPHYTEKFMGRWQRTLLDADAGVYRYDTLFVLKKTQMPAVLLEAGSIANRDEELVMASPERQQLISAAVVDAVDSFCVAQSHKPALQIVQRSKARHMLSAHSHRRVRGRPATPRH